MPKSNAPRARKSSIWRKVPGYARAILMAQFTIIVFLGTWMYLEYQNNLYLQSYLKTSLQSNTPALLTIIPATLAIGTITVYAKLLRGGKEFQRESYVDVAELQPLEMPRPIVSYPDEIRAPQPRENTPQLRRTLSPSRPRRRTLRKGGRALSGTDRQTGAKKTRTPNVSEP